MDCKEFAQRMHERLDNRHALEADDELCRHAQGCEACRSQLDAWQLVSSVMPSQPVVAPAKRGGNEYSRSLLAVVTVAAAILWMVSVVPYVEEPIEQRVEEAPTALAQVSADQLDPADWWQSVQERDWVGQTMPTVRSVQEGVAPLGRSLMRAVTILTVGGREQTS